MTGENTQIVVREYGVPDVLVVEHGEIPAPGFGEVRVRNTAIGLNFIDTYFRTGLYPASLPLIPGLEGAGVVDAVGEGVTHVSEGDRVAYCGPMGAYSHYLLRPAGQLVVIPDGVTDEQAAAGLLKGLTAHYLLHSTYPLRSGESVLIHAAAGGVGQLLCQWARSMGAQVIGSVGSAGKVAAAQAAGCHHVLVNDQSGIAEAVRNLTGGGVDVVYDGVGNTTFMDSLDCLRKRGMMVSFGNASGAVEPFKLAELATRGSLFVTRPNLADYISDPQELRQRSDAVFRAIADGTLTVTISHRYQLTEAARAHTDLEGRLTQASMILIP